MYTTLKFSAIALLIGCFYLFELGCKDTDDNQSVCDPQTLEDDPPGQWYFGDFHVHATGASNDTGGDSYPEDIQQKARARGLHFLVLADHSNSNGSDPDTLYENPTLFNKGPEFPYWQEAANLTIPNEFLMIDGCEISPVSTNNNLPTGHIGCVPINLADFDTNTPFIDRPMGTVTGNDALQQAISRDCFVILYHPYSAAPWVGFDWTGYDYNAMEIWNGTIGYDPFDGFSRDAWRCDLLNGRDVTAVGGSDCHRHYIDAPGFGLDPAIGYPITAVWANELTWPAIINGLQAGKTAVFEGNSRLFIDGYDATGCRNETAQMRILRLRGQVDSLLNNTHILLTRATACSDTRPSITGFPTIVEDTLLYEPLTGGEAFDKRIDIGGEKGVYTAYFKGNMEGHYGALTRAIVIE